MKDSRNITIGLLLITAAILTAMVIVTYAPGRAYGDTPDRRGNYIMLAGQWSTSTDLIYVLNIATKRMNVYYADGENNTFSLIDAIDLQRVFGKVVRVP